MRIWSLHPAQLDRVGLVACWRETLLAQKVLAGGTRGYTRHPQLVRFRAAADPGSAVGAYLAGLADEADARGYRFDRSRITVVPVGPVAPITVTSGQLAYEWRHLVAKVEARDPAWAQRLAGEVGPRPHPLLVEVPGDVEGWEVVTPVAR